MNLSKIRIKIIRMLAILAIVHKFTTIGVGVGVGATSAVVTNDDENDEHADEDDTMTVHYEDSIEKIGKIKQQPQKQHPMNYLELNKSAFLSSYMTVLNPHDKNDADDVSTQQRQLESNNNNNNDHYVDNDEEESDIDVREAPKTGLIVTRSPRKLNFVQLVRENFVTNVSNSANAKTNQDILRTSNFSSIFGNGTEIIDQLINDDDDVNAGFWKKFFQFKYLRKIVICSIFIIICLTCVFGNILVILSVFTYRPLQSVQNIFIVSLAVADTFVAVFVMPFHIIYNITEGKWLFGTLVCHFFLLLDILLCTASTLHLCCIALDRYWAIKDSIHYAQKRTMKRVLLMILVAWVASLIISLPVVIWNTKTVRSVQSTDTASTTAGLMEIQCDIPTDKLYRFYSSSGTFFVPLFIMTFVYVRIYMETKRRLRERAKTAKKLANTMANASITSEPRKKQSAVGAVASANGLFGVQFKHFLCCASGAGLTGDTNTPVTTETNRSFRATTKSRSSASSFFSSSKRKKSKKKTLFINEIKGDTGEKIQSHKIYYDKSSNDPAVDETVSLNKSNVDSEDSNQQKQQQQQQQQTPHLMLYEQTTGSPIQLKITGVQRPVQITLQVDHVNEKSEFINNSLDLLDHELDALNERLDKTHKKYISIGTNTNTNTRRSSSQRKLKVTMSEEAHLIPINSSQHPTTNEPSSSGNNNNNNNNNNTNNTNNQASTTHAAHPTTNANKPMSSTSTWLREQTTTSAGITLKQRQKISLTRERKAARTLGIIMGAFTLCWFPFFLLYLLQSFDLFLDSPRLFEFLTWLGYVNSALNPIIYTVFNLDFRKSFERILFKCILCKRR